MITIDFDELTEGGRVHNLTGRDLGRRAREQLNLEELDKSDDEVRILVPDHIYLITPSFFIGMFAASVSLQGSLDKFFQKYKFESEPSVLRQVHDAAKRVLSVANKGASAPF